MTKSLNLSGSLIVQKGLVSQISSFRVSTSWFSIAMSAVGVPSVGRWYLQTNCLFGMLRHLKTPPSPHSLPLSKPYMGYFQNLVLTFQVPWCFSKRLSSGASELFVALRLLSACSLCSSLCCQSRSQELSSRTDHSPPSVGSFVFSSLPNIKDADDEPVETCGVDL